MRRPVALSQWGGRHAADKHALTHPATRLGLTPRVSSSMNLDAQPTNLQIGLLSVQELHTLWRRECESSGEHGTRAFCTPQRRQIFRRDRSNTVSPVPNNVDRYGYTVCSLCYSMQQTLPLVVRYQRSLSLASFILTEFQPFNQLIHRHHSQRLQPYRQ
jgi:hypothetical protein